MNTLTEQEVFAEVKRGAQVAIDRAADRFIMPEVKWHMSGRGLAGYQAQDDFIRVHLLSIKNAQGKTGFDFDAFTLGLFVMAHELGHAADADIIESTEKRVEAASKLSMRNANNSRYANIIKEETLRVEKSAWTLGLDFVPAEHIAGFNEFNQYNMARYQENLEEMLSSYLKHEMA